jgi:hypothetical protein
MEMYNYFHNINNIFLYLYKLHINEHLRSGIDTSYAISNLNDTRIVHYLVHCSSLQKNS